MHNDELRQLFPNLKPTDKPPGLFTLNGIGLSMYGKRDVHAETGAYLKTRCFCFVFIPLLAIGAHRVMDAENGGWYFLGREPLSHFAKTWNLAFLLGLTLLIGIGGYSSTMNSPAYRSKRMIAKAKTAASAGKLAEAVHLYEQALYLHPPKRAKGRAAIKQILTEKLPNANAATVGQVFRYFARQRPARLRKAQPSLFPVGQTLATKWRQKAPATSLQILDVLANVAPTPKAASAIVQRQVALLESMLKAKPKAKGPALASRLAALYQRTEHCRRCMALLKPYEKALGTKALGTLEGARILGEQYAKRRQYRSAHRFLAPYVSAHIHTLHKAERKYKRMVSIVRARTIKNLKRGKGPREFRRKSFKRLPSKTRTLKYIMYVQGELRGSARVASASLALRKASKVVPVAMGLGIVKLQLARQSRDPNQRRKGLREAEKVFLSIRSVAGRSDQYKLYLGQVYYWLGQQDKGKQLFDQLLRKRKRAPQQLLQLARILREVGDRSAARRMAEEAYNKAKKPAVKYRAASLRALTSLKLTEKAMWLKRSDQGSPSIRALLNSTLGAQAWQQGAPKRAATHYRAAIKAYDAMSKHPAALNNSALAYFALFQATGERSAFQKGIAQIQEAVALQPNDSILLYNAADALQRAALLDLLSKQFSPGQLKLQVKLSLLTTLYSSEAQRAPLMARFADHTALQKARDLFRKVLLLSPNNAYVYESLGRLYNTLRDTAGMREVMRRFAKSRIEHSDTDAQTRSLYSNKQALRLRFVFRKELKQRLQLIRSLQKRGKSKETGILSARTVYTYIAHNMYGGAPQAKAAVALATRAFKVTPSSFSRRALIDALLYQTTTDLSAKVPDFRKLRNFGRRSLMPRGLLAVAMHDAPALRAQILKAPTFQRAASLLRTHAKVLPKRSTPLVWALLRWTAPPLAATGAKLLQQDIAGQQYRTLLHKLHPFRAGYALALYFNALALDKKDEAARLRKRFGSQNIPLPFLENLPQQVQRTP